MQLIAAVIVAALLPLSPPTDRIGSAGWAIGAGMVVLGVGAGLRLLRAPSGVTPNELLLLSYLTLAQITLLQWLAGEQAPFAELFLITALYTGSAHPPRRVAVFLLALAAAAAAPLIYDGWDPDFATLTVTRLLLWFGLTGVSMLFTATVRAQRMSLAEAGDEARIQARRDPLTGLGNRRAFDEVLARAVPGTRRSDRPFSILIADLEGFKSINDKFGHLEGDRCLREVADAFRATVRGPDALFRWGGDEFAIVLPATDYDAATVVGSRLREAVRRSVVLRDGQPLRLRYGVAEAEPEMDGGALVAAADLSLMSAKMGRASREAPPKSAEQP